MKFSSLEQKVIKDLCLWGKTANVFSPIRNFFRENVLIAGTGVFLFSKEEGERPPIILCINIDKHNGAEYENICNHILFQLHFLRKLERLGLVTISEGRYSEDKEYAFALFKDISVIGLHKTEKEPWGYSARVLLPQDEPLDVELIASGLTLRRRDNRMALPYHNMEIFSRFDAFDLVSSNIALEQELFSLVGNGFKTTEELILENASMQLATAEHILEEARVQTEKAVESVKQSKVQFETAQTVAREQFEESQQNAKNQFEAAQRSSSEQFTMAQAAAKTQFEEAQNNSKEQFVNAQTNAKTQFEIGQTNANKQFKDSMAESIRQFKSANCKSRIALVLAMLSILTAPIVAKYVETTIDKKQIEQIDNRQTEILKKLDDINSKFIEPKIDTTIIKIAEELNKISLSLEEINTNSFKKNKKPINK